MPYGPQGTDGGPAQYFRDNPLSARAERVVKWICGSLTAFGVLTMIFTVIFLT